MTGLETWQIDEGNGTVFTVCQTFANKPPDILTWRKIMRAYDDFTGTWVNPYAVPMEAQQPLKPLPPLVVGAPIPKLIPVQPPAAPEPKPKRVPPILAPVTKRTIVF